jgi:superfamily I DNA and/or RNA helicase
MSNPRLLLHIPLIVFPPCFSGKTTLAALLISTALRLPMGSAIASDNLEEHIYKKPRVLAVAHSNGAADVLIEALLKMGVPAVRLGRPASVSPSVQHRTIPAITQKLPDVVKLRQTAYDLSLDSQTRSAAAYELMQSVNDMKQTIIEAAPVVVTSCITAHQLLETGVTFPIVILDEAAQTTEPALVCALASAKASQVVLVGDTQQLPPTVTSEGLRDTLGVSPMARLEKAGVAQQTLRVQYRMPPFLLEHPSRYFYDGLVSCAPGSHTETLQPSGFPWPASQPLAFIQVGNDSEVTHSFGGKSNPTEAELVSNIVSDLLEGGDVGGSDIAVITPYSKQVQLIRSELANLRKTPSAQHIRVGTVDSFQGQEVNIVIFSAVRSNPMNELGFLRDSRRLCVAITRAKRGLILVGDQKTLRSCRHWAALLESCEARGCSLDRKDLEKRYTLASLGGIADSSVVDEVLQELFDKSSDDLLGLF